MRSNEALLYPNTQLHLGQRLFWIASALGIWQIATAMSFTSSCERIWISELISGFTFLILGALCLREGKATLDTVAPTSLFSFSWAWAVALLGIWNLAAPILLWAPSGLSYLQGDLVGVIAIFFSTILPSYEKEMPGSNHTPLGWSFNPSSWSQRLPTLALCFLCWMIARYMACYQLGYLDHIVDPFFRDGTLKVITSDLSKSFPISDAGLGAFVYTIEFLLGCRGGPSRWYRMPWLVAMFALMVVPAGVVSILLIMSQPILVGAWCGWCLLTAFFMLTMIAFTLDEMLAVAQLLLSAKSSKEFWHLFFKGLPSLPKSSSAKVIDKKTCRIVRGVSAPWNLVLSAFLAAFLMFLPDIFSLEGNLAYAMHILGACVTTSSIIAMNELARPLRNLNALIGCLLMVSILFWGSLSTTSSLIALAIGLLFIIFSLPKGRIHEEYGRWNASLFR